MLTLPQQLRVFAAKVPTDMRKSFSGLVGIVEKELGQQVEAGGLFLFFSRRRNAVKAMDWPSFIVASNAEHLSCRKPWPRVARPRASNSR
jgi:IS66 Orf2 like protein